MGKIYYVMGKSSSGKDTIFKELLKKEELSLHKIVLYTTRPARADERDGVQYYFVDEKKLSELQEDGRVIEMRVYHTVCGLWKYFTVDDENINLEKNSYLSIGTLESFEKLKKYYGEEKIIPVYVEVSDDIRLDRALKRERNQEKPQYGEMCRRFLADCSDFAEEKIKEAGIVHRFSNDGTIDECIQDITEFVLKKEKEL